jgi:hypothetical protein
MTAILDLKAQPHNSMPYVHIGVPFFMDFSNTKEEGNNLS